MRAVFRTCLQTTVASSMLIAAGTAQAQAEPSDGGKVEDIVVTGRRGVETPVEKIKEIAPVIVDTVTSEQIDKTPDLSLPELLERLPGVSSTGFYGTSEPGYSNIRGFDSRYNSMDIDGNPILFSSQNNRGSQSGMFPAAIVKEASVYKTLTPDMDGNSIGGHVSLRTLRAFDGGTQPYFKVNYRIGFPENRSSIFGGPSDTISAVGKFTFGSEHQFGFVFGFNRQRTSDYDDFGSVLGYAQVVGPDGQKHDQINSNTFTDSRYDKTVRNTAGYAKLEWRKEDQLYAFLSGNVFDEQRNMYLDRSGPFIANTGGRTVTQTGPGQANFTNAQGQIREYDYDMKRYARVVGFGVDYKVMDRGSFSLRGNYTDYGNDTLTRNLGNGFRLASFNGFYDINGNVPVIQPSDPATYNNTANWLFSSAANSTYQRTQPLRDKIYTLGAIFNYNNQADAQGFGAEGGANWVRLDRSFDQNLTYYVLNKGVTLNLSQIVPAGSTMYRNEAALGSYNAFWDFMTNPANATSTSSHSATAAYQLREDVTAFHAAAYYTLGRFKAMAGFRYEHTGDTTDTSQTVSGALQPQHRVHNYGNWMPNIQLSYEPIDRLKLRAAFSKTIGRADFQDFAPGTTTTFNSAGVTVVSGSNPNLAPRVSTNYDASAEYYFRDGMISAAVFHKDIAGETFSQITNITDSSGQLIEIDTIPLNTGSARVTGFEVSAMKKHLDFLPGPLKNLGISANYTRLDGTWNVVLTNGSTRSVGGLRAQPKWMANVSATYDAGPLDLTVSYKKQGRIFTGTFGTDATGDIWIRPYSRLDAQAALQVMDRVRLTFDAKNITNKYYIQTTGTEDSIYNSIGNGRSYWIGVSFKY